MSKSHGPLRVGIGGPVGSGKTALMDLLCKAMRERYDIAAITNDIYTKWDAEFLVRSGSLTPDRIAGVETGGCPHTAIREDASMNLAAVADMRMKFPDLDLVLIESGGDNLAATFSPELADLTIYVIDVAAGDKIPSKGGPGITRSDLLVINKIDLAPHVGASLQKMDTDAKRMRGERPFVMTNLKKSEGLDRITGVETGGCPHTAIREDASMNLAAVADMRAKFPDLDLVLIESGGDNLAATFSPELADLTIYVIDVAAGDKIPSKGGPGITRSDLLVINKIDLAPHVGASLQKMDTDAKRMRGERPFVMTNLKKSEGLDRIIGFIEAKGGLTPAVHGKAG